MDEREQGGEVVVNVDYSGESLVLADPESEQHNPGAFAGEARVEVDPLVEAFARSPYDPVIGAMMMGRATGEVIRRPPGRPWMRSIAYILALGMIGQLSMVAYIALNGDSPFIVAGTLSGLAFALALAWGGMLLLLRLLRS